MEEGAAHEIAAVRAEAEEWDAAAGAAKRVGPRLPFFLFILSDVTIRRS